jgi:hypothetical protein
LVQLAALHVEGAFVTAQDASPSAVGTGLVLAQGLGLLFEQGLQGSLGETGGRGESDLLHGREIDVESRPLVPVDASGDDFAPLGGKLVEFLEFVGCEGVVCHDASCFEVKTKMSSVESLSDYKCDLDAAKLFMTAVPAPLSC